MEMSQGEQCIAILNKNDFFFFFLQKWRTGGQNKSSLQGGRMWCKGVGGWIWCHYCAHVYVNRKVRPAETILGIVEGE
jgi:hypothetical protein